MLIVFELEDPLASPLWLGVGGMLELKSSDAAQDGSGHAEEDFSKLKRLIKNDGSVLIEERETFGVESLADQVKFRLRWPSVQGNDLRWHMYFAFVLVDVCVDLISNFARKLEE